jgi:hypothetical protein
MTGIQILLGMNVILRKILVKLMFAKKLAGQKNKFALQVRAGQPCPATVSATNPQV